MLKGLGWSWQWLDSKIFSCLNNSVIKNTKNLQENNILIVVVLRFSETALSGPRFLSNLFIWADVQNIFLCLIAEA